MNTNKGFTLVELLTVIAIIIILSAIIMANISGARAKARDAERIANLKEVQLALETYKQVYDRYPAAGCGRNQSWTGHGSSFGACAQYIAGTENITRLPVDPINTQQGYIYKVNLAGTEYKFMAYYSVEGEIVDANHEYARYPAGAGCTASMGGAQTKTYAVYHDVNPGNGAGGECY